MATNDSTSKKKTKTVSKERQFKGLSLTERKEARREKLIEAGIATYGTLGFFFSDGKRCLPRSKTHRALFL